jgi:MGT family glycosyltransferase
MAHIGAITIENSSHVSMMAKLGGELQRRGHRVTVIGLPDGKEKVRGAGLEFIEIGAREFPLGSMPRLVEEFGGLKGRAAMNFTFQNYSRKARVIMSYAPDAIREAQIGPMLIDQYALGAASVADMLGKPYVALCNALAVNREPAVPPFHVPWRHARSTFGRLRNELADRALRWLTSPIRRALNEQRSAWGLPPDPAYEETATALATVAQQPRCFDFPREQLPANFHFTGPFLEARSSGPGDFPFERLDGRPLIYASLGTVQNQLRHVFEIIAAACEGLPAQLVLTLGSRDAALDLRGAGSAIVVPYAPQLELIARAALVVCHGGLNTALESLSQGVPLVAIPISNDQPGVAGRIVYHGVGEMVPLSSLTVARLRRAITRVLDDPSYRRQAQLQRAEIARCGGLKHAADIVERAFASGKPVIRAES